MPTKSIITVSLDNAHSLAKIDDSDGEGGIVLSYNWTSDIDSDYKSNLAQMHIIKDRWREIHTDVADYVPAGSSILDLGCGDKDILNTISVDSDGDYYGIDLYSGADLQYDLDGDLLTLDKTWDVGLCIESLGFIKDPGRLLDHYKQYATTWVITVRPLAENHSVRARSEVNVRHCWTRDTLITFLNQHFSSVTVSDLIYTNILTYKSGYPKPFLIAVCIP
jgi:hypothetical protein